MRKNRLTITGLFAALFALIIIGAGSSAMAVIPQIDPNSATTYECFTLIDMYWNMCEAKYRFEEAPFNSDPANELQKAYIKIAREVKTFSGVIAEKAIQAYDTNDQKVLGDIVAVYLSFKKALRAPLYGVADQVIDHIAMALFNKNGGDLATIRKQVEQEYFPGYGYSDPSYMYRKGMEVERKFLQAYWKIERETIEATNYMELVIQAELVASLQAQVDFLKILQLFKIEISGKLVAAAKVSFQTKTTLTTECKVKYEKNKVWFELSRARKDYWMEPKWEVCGKTYLFLEEPTGEEIVSDLPQISTPAPAPAKIASDCEGFEALLQVMAEAASNGDSSIASLVADWAGRADEESLRAASELLDGMTELRNNLTVNDGMVDADLNRAVNTVENETASM